MLRLSIDNRTALIGTLHFDLFLELFVFNQKIVVLLLNTVFRLFEEVYFLVVMALHSFDNLHLVVIIATGLHLLNIFLLWFIFKMGLNAFGLTLYLCPIEFLKRFS